MAARRTVTISRGRDSGIQKLYVDALGRRHAAPRDTVRAIERAMTAGPTSAGRGALVVRAGSRTRVGPADVHLEGGGVLSIGRELPADLPARLPRARRPERPAAAADRRACDVSSAGGSRHVGLGDSALCRALAPQLGHRRSRRSALAGALGPPAGRRHRADQPAGRAGPDDSAAAEPVFPLEPAFSQPAVPAHRGSGRRARRGRRPRSRPHRPSPQSRSPDRPRRGLQAEVPRARSDLASRRGNGQTTASTRSGVSRAGCASSRRSARSPRDSAPAGGNGRRSTGIHARRPWRVSPAPPGSASGSPFTSGCSIRSIGSWRGRRPPCP